MIDTNLQVALKRSERMRKISAFCLTAPALVFLVVTFVLPISSVLIASVHNPGLVKGMPSLGHALRAWDGKGLPPPQVTSALAYDLITLERTGGVPSMLNSRVSGFHSLLKKTRKSLQSSAATEGLDTVVTDPRLYARLGAIDSRWKQRRYWSAMDQTAAPFTIYYFLRAVDRELDADGNIVRVPEDRRRYVATILRTLGICTLVTVLANLAAFPIAYLLASLPTRQCNYLLLFLLMPLWISILVKTTGWLVSLQSHGVLNDAAVFLGIWDERVQLVYNRIGTYVSMVHILIPFAALPLFGVMKRIDPQHMRAAAILGASPRQAFVRVYLPQALPGVAASILIAFILALGLYIPPALIGGPSDQMLSGVIAQGWFRAPLSVILLTIVTVFLLLYRRAFGLIAKSMTG